MKYKLNIAWLYPDLMSTYGDRGNIITLQKRCEWRGIEVETLNITIDTPKEELEKADLIFMGGAQDTQQEIVNDDLFKNKGKILKDLIEKGIPSLFICGAYQFLGKHYRTAEGKQLKGLGIFPLFTENPGENTERLIGNIVIERDGAQFVGFENHGGRTYLEDEKLAFGKVIKGHGNNGNQPRLDGGQAGDETEGVRYKNAIGTYLHGPLLPKNPEIADDLIEKAIELKFGEKIKLKKLDDSLVEKARDSILHRILS